MLGSCTGSSCIDWLAGEYSYTFHVILPDNLPTSFDGKYGQIHYEIITTIERSARYPKVFKLPFTVIQPLDLNADAIYRVSHKRLWYIRTAFRYNTQVFLGRCRWRYSIASASGAFAAQRDR